MKEALIKSLKKEIKFLVNENDFRAKMMKENEIKILELKEIIAELESKPND